MEGQVERLPSLHIWTDGSLKEKGNPKILGMAAVVCYGGAGRSLLPEVRAWRVEANKTSSMHAELFAIQCALESIPTHLKHSCRLVIISDCRPAVEAIQTKEICKRYRKMVEHIRELLDCFPQHRIVWCRSHSGKLWNELANQVAQKTAGTWKGHVTCGYTRA